MVEVAEFSINKVKYALETFAHNIGAYESTSTDASEKTKLTAIKNGILKLIKILEK